MAHKELATEPAAEETKRRLTTLAEEGLDAYPLTGRVTLLNHTINTTFRVDARPRTDSAAAGGTVADEERFMLRIYRPGSYSAAAIRSEVAWLKALRQGEGLGVPEPVATADGAALAVLGGETATPRFCVLFRWLEGRFASGDLTASQVAQIGAFLGRLHRFSERFAAPAEFDRPRFDLAGLLGTGPVSSAEQDEDLLSRADRQLLDEAATYVRGELQSLGEGPEVSGLIHGDMTPKNCLFHRDELRVLDFADCGWGYYPYDVATSLLRFTDRDDYPMLRDAFLEGYRRVRPLPPAHEAAIETFQICRHIYLLRWLCHFLELPEIRERAADGFPYLTAQVRRLLDRRRSPRSGTAPRRLAAMSTVQLIAHLHQADVELWAEGDQLRFSAPKGALSPELRDELAKRKGELLSFLRQTTTAAAAGAPPLEPVPRTAAPSLSFAQERLWFFDRYEPQSSAYNMSTVWRLRGAVQVAALWGALVEIVRRHEVLRTTFADADGRPLQVIAPRLVPGLPAIDLGRLPASVRDRSALELARWIARRPFDLSRGPLLRLALVRLSAEEHLFVFAIHHIAADGWSSGILATELLVLYEALLDRGPAAAAAALPALPVQYADFAHWQRQWLTGEVIERQLGYWQRQLEGAPQVLELPTDRRRPSRPSYEAGKQVRLLPSALLRAVEALSQREGCTPFMAHLAAFGLLLQRTTGERDLLVGSPIANRNRAELEGLIGFFANTLVLRTRIQPETSFRQLLEQVREVTLGAFEHQDVPFEKVVEMLQPERALNYNPLVQVMLVLQNAPGPPLERSGLEMQIEPAAGGQVVFDLIANLQETADGLRLSLRYPRTLFDDTTMAAWARRYQVLVEHLVADPDEVLWQVELLTPAERQQLVAEWNDTGTPARPEKLLHELFEGQVERTPEAPAVVFEGEQLSYRELDRRANQLARHLHSLGVAPEMRVGICAERSPELVVGLLGILKAGGAYVPLDPTYPAQRLSFMAETAGVRVLLTQERLRATLPELAERICLDRDLPAISVQTTGRPETATRSDHPAYVIFTSGSTGQPKGSMVSHRAIVNRILWMQEAYGLREGEGVLQKTPFSFDVSVWEFFWPLAVGARLVVARPGGHQDGAYLAQVVAEQEVTTLHFVPSMLQAFLEQPLEACDPRTGGPLKRVIASGEALPFALQERFFGRLGAELHILYGPTEAAVDVTWWRCERGSARRSVPIGRPIANLRIHLLDRDLGPVPPPVAGELHIGGAGLARGYVGRPDLTAERFVPDPFSRELSGEPGARLYKTGDLARYGAGGAIEFLGR
ncbi:MAG: amino acid adenylation domain-containing protein, partial [bacterium]|nr:amino acid adenylation domain-containing protein [bacterium]